MICSRRTVTEKRFEEALDIYSLGDVFFSSERVYSVEMYLNMSCQIDLCINMFLAQDTHTTVYSNL